jgi:hypothetical protein
MMINEKHNLYIFLLMNLSIYNPMPI